MLICCDVFRGAEKLALVLENGTQTVKGSITAAFWTVCYLQRIRTEKYLEKLWDEMNNKEKNIN